LRNTPLGEFCMKARKRSSLASVRRRALCMAPPRPAISSEDTA
jgi:hypothetical protein